jgi:2-oxoglutarate ferredoxin oxidoreductase subunit alpha
MLTEMKSSENVKEDCMSVPEKKSERLVLVDGSRLIMEAMVRAGADVFIGYPITPANLMYLYGSERFPIALAAPDEITTLQWMSGFSAAGKLPVTATSFPGFALMVESINMAYMMELPMVIILSQRLGPASGTATCGAQGDLSLINGLISGGYPVATLCISKPEECWQIAAASVSAAVKLRAPVILLTSKEMVMTSFSFNVDSLAEIKPVTRKFYSGEARYHPYLPRENRVPDFLPVGDHRHQVRLTASTHDTGGILRSPVGEARENTLRLPRKMGQNLPDYTYYELDETEGAEGIVVSYGITSQAARAACNILKEKGKRISLLIAKTLCPLPPVYGAILEKYRYIVVAEENYGGQFRQMLFGNYPRVGVSGVNAVANMVTPMEIVKEIENND